MKNIKMFKKLVIVMLSLALIAICSGNVMAADDDLFTSVGSDNSTSNSATPGNSTDNNTTDNNTTEGSLTTNNNNTNNNTTRNTNTNNTTNTNLSTNRNVTNTLAKTGLSNSGSIIALVVVVCGVSAIYSYKKVNDYKKL